MFRAYIDGTSSTIYNTKELEEIIHNSMSYYETRVHTLEERVKMLENDAKLWIDNKTQAEIQSLKNQLSLSYGEFASQKEKNAYEEFEKIHMHNRTTSKYNGGRAPYLIPTGTGFGTNLRVVCPICGESKDITDTEAW